MDPIDASLAELAGLYGIHVSYWDITGVQRHAPPESLLAVLRVLGAPLGSMADVPRAIRERRQWEWRRGLEPVCVTWDGAGGHTPLRVPRSTARIAETEIVLESGDVRTERLDLQTLSVADAGDVDGETYDELRLPIPANLPPGYHTFAIRFGGRAFESLLISAPRKAHDSAEHERPRDWGVFVPLYALHSARSLGAGDFTDFESLVGWVGDLGGGVVGTLPLLAAFLTDPFQPSPYMPASRLFWNEFYLDLERIPELELSPEARAMMDSPGFQEEALSLRSASEVDYRRVMALKRRVLEKLARRLFSEASERREELMRFADAGGAAADYARFRAVGERRRAGWPVWPSPMRDGVLGEADHDAEVRDYHLYVQWLAAQQVQKAGETAQRYGPGLYIDLPIGVHPDSYDVWRERSLYTEGISVGAPPDPFASDGQNWGFPALHPERIREDRYRHVIDILRHHMGPAGMLRIDHVMALHRLFWIPQGMPGAGGVYVSYPAEELHAILCLESHRNRCMIIGEDLGTVSDEVRSAMKAHGFQRMYVAQTEFRQDAVRALGDVARASVASVNTHDMFLFAAHWGAADVDDRVRLGLLSADEASEERDRRARLRQAVVEFLAAQGLLSATEDPMAVLRAILAHLAESEARIVTLTLEDLWLETRPQNIPGVSDDRYPNWRRKARWSVEEFGVMPDVLAILEMVRSRRATA